MNNPSVDGFLREPPCVSCKNFRFAIKWPEKMCFAEVMFADFSCFERKPEKVEKEWPNL